MAKHYISADRRPHRTQRVIDVKAFCEETGVSLKEVAEEAGLNYGSMANQLSSLQIGSERLRTIELAAVRLAEFKAKRTGQLVEQFKSTLETAA